MSLIESLFCRSAPWQRITRAVVLPWALQGQQLRGDVLEVGGGSGAMAAQLLATSAADDDLRVTVTDFDDAMVDAARINLRHYENRVSVRVADATNLPFPDASFDVVASFLMLHHVIDWESSIADAVRVLRPGGSFIGYDLVSTIPARVVHFLDRSPHRFIKAEEIGPVFAALPLESIELAHAPGLVRFRATKSTQSSRD